jgi:hypothetical protein
VGSRGTSAEATYGVVWGCEVTTSGAHQ